jgi:hypothetical protein
MPSSSLLPPILTLDLLNSIRKHPDLPPHVWYIITVSVLTVLNCPDEVPKVYEHALKFGPSETASTPEHEEQLHISRRIREALIKTSAVVGVPKVCMLYCQRH